MDVDNWTAWPAKLFRSPLEGDRFAAALVARVTFDLRPQGPVPSGDQPWIVSNAPWDSEHGQVEGDEIFYRGGVDLFLFGTAKAPPRGATEMTVELSVGRFRRSIRVIGDRAWVRRGRGLEPTAPLSFRTMPLSLANAFGGKSTWDGLEVPYPDNPAGRGYAVDEKLAEGTRLPNLEDPGQPIRKWDDRPDPVGLGFCPMTCGLRLRNGVVMSDKGEMRAIKPTLFNAAFPAMIAERVQAGDPVRIVGVTDSGAPLIFAVPDLPLTARLQFGDEVIERPLAIDQLGIEAEKQRIFVTYRYPFRYVMYRRQQRSCGLYARPAAALIERAS
jgi:hypothetical protein